MYSQQPALIDLQSIWFTVFFKKKKKKKSALRCFEIKSGQQVIDVLYSEERTSCGLQKGK